MSQHISLVSSYANHHLADAALKKLQHAGFDMREFTLVSHQANGNEAAVTQVVDTLAGLDAENHACIPRESIQKYEEELNTDRLLLVAHGTEEEIARARAIIDEDHPDGWDGNVGCAVYYGC